MHGTLFLSIGGPLYMGLYRLQVWLHPLQTTRLMCRKICSGAGAHVAHLAPRRSGLSDETLWSQARSL